MRVPPAPNPLRRALLTTALLGLGPLRHDPAHAAGSSLAALTEAQAKLKEVDGLLALPSQWPEAAQVLSAPPLQVSTLTKLFDAAIDQPTAKERVMDQSAFIVYYEEARYGDLRLEPQTPSRRAEQNGLKKEMLRAVEDELAEVNFLIRQPHEDASDLRAYSARAQQALGDFLALTAGAQK